MRIKPSAKRKLSTVVRTARKLRQAIELNMSGNRQENTLFYKINGEKLDINSDKGIKLHIINKKRFSRFY